MPATTLPADVAAVRDILGAAYEMRVGPLQKRLFDDTSFADYRTNHCKKPTCQKTVNNWRLGNVGSGAGAVALIDLDGYAMDRHGIDGLIAMAGVRLSAYGLRCVVDETVAPTGRELIDVVNGLPMATARIHQAVADAKRDNVITAPEARVILARCSEAKQEIAEIEAAVTPALAVAS